MIYEPTRVTNKLPAHLIVPRKAKVCLCAYACTEVPDQTARDAQSDQGLRCQNPWILQNVSMEGKGPDEILRMRRMKWICTCSFRAAKLIIYTRTFKRIWHVRVYKWTISDHYADFRDRKINYPGSKNQTKTVTCYTSFKHLMKLHLKTVGCKFLVNFCTMFWWC